MGEERRGATLMLLAHASGDVAMSHSIVRRKWLQAPLALPVKEISISAPGVALSIGLFGGGGGVIGF